jgi:hypothetical protein
VGGEIVKIANGDERGVEVDEVAGKEDLRWY